MKITEQITNLLDKSYLKPKYVIKPIEHNKVMIIIDKGIYSVWTQILSESKLFNTRQNPDSQYGFILIIDKNIYNELNVRNRRLSFNPFKKNSGK